MLEDAIELLTKQMLKEHFENKETIITMTKTELYQFCIKLVKLLKKFEEGCFDEELLRPTTRAKSSD